MNFNALSPNELERFLKLARRRKAQLDAEFNSAQNNFLTAMGGNSSIEKRQALSDHADFLNAELVKINGYISKIEERLGGFSSTHFSPPQINVNIEVNTSPSTTDESAAETNTESVHAFPTLHSKVKSADNLNKRATHILNLLKVQVSPSAICVEPNDAIIKAIFNQSKSKINVTEKRKSKRKAAVTSKLNLQGAPITDTPLDEFDRAVLGVIISEYDIGNRYTTFNIIHRALIGKVGVQSAVICKDQKAAITNSVKKLMGTVVDFSGVNENLKKLKYTVKDGNHLSFKLENLLSAGVLDAKVNGQPVDDVIYFKDSCPLFDIANLKDQVIRYPHSLLDVPNQNNTPLVITLKKYVMRRICEIKLHTKHLKPTITFDDVFSKCKLINANAKKKFDARNIIFKFLEHLKAQNFISDFEVKKDGREFSKVSFTFNPQDEGHT